MPYKANFLDKHLGQPIVFYAIALLWASCIWYISYSFGQKDFFRFFPFYTFAFAAWIWLFQQDLSLRQLLGLSLFVRLGLLLAFPSLSDDIYRFFWDGRLIISGVSPYGILPTEALSKSIPLLDQTLFAQLNSPNYYTIYPPINQLYFAISALVGDIISATMLMKILFIVTETIGLLFMVKLLIKLEMKINDAAIFVLNPLVIIEGVGNLHYEVIMLSLLCISIYYIFNNKLLYGAGWMAISIGIKLLPLMLVPYLWFRLPKDVKWKFFVYLTLFLLITFLPVINGIHFSTFLESIDLYFRKFEFNASIYYLLRYIGQQITGYNLIQYLGPILGIATIGFNIYQATKSKTSSLQSFMQYALMVWTAYLLLATTVHPWYVMSILFFSIFTSWKFSLVWSYLIILSYVNYSFPSYYENMWWIAIEYIILLGWMRWEMRNRKIGKRASLPNSRSLS